MAGADTVIAGRYRIVRSLGAGGMGRVWLANDEMLGRQVAIKEITLPSRLVEDERDELLRWTLREAQAAARLSHPNVIQIYDVQSGDERPWIVMEYVASRSLLQLIKENGPLPVDQVAGVGLAVLSALDAASRVGVLHHDVKPSNVLVASDGRVVLTDFGSAVMDHGDNALTRSSVVLGSPQYVAPERLHNGVSTPQSDLWSLGATLYHAVEGRPPYSRETTTATLAAVATSRPDPSHRAGPLDPVLSGLLRRDPRARMTPAEVEHRLWRLADVQTTVQLHRVPEPRRTPMTTATRYPVGDTAGSSERRSPEVAVRPVSTPRPRPGAELARRLSRRRLTAVAAVLAAMLGLTVLVVSADRGQSSWAGGVTAATTWTDQLSPSPFVIPAGFQWWTDQSGFRVAVPAGWSASRAGAEAAVFAAPAGQPTLRIGAWAPASPDPVTALVAEERNARRPGYRRIRIEALPLPPGAVWEYTFDDPSTGPRRGLERVLVGRSGSYLIRWQTAPGDWAGNLQNLDVVIRSFRGAHGT